MTDQIEKNDKQPASKTFNSAVLTFALQFIPLYAFWIVLSGKTSGFYLVMGGLTCLAVVVFSRTLFNSLSPVNKCDDLSIMSAVQTAWRLIVYIPWLIIQIVKDNVLVAYLVLHPKMPINPKLIKFKTGLKRPVAQTVLANSITLSPGTITVFLENSEYIVHMLVPSSSSKLTSAEAQNRVGRIFFEDHEGRPQVKWADSFREFEQQ